MLYFKLMTLPEVGDHFGNSTLASIPYEFRWLAIVFKPERNYCTFLSSIY